MHTVVKGKHPARVHEKAVTTLSHEHDEIHSDMSTRGDARKETAVVRHQYTRTHGFLVVSCPLKKILALTYTWAQRSPHWMAKPCQQKRW